MFSSCVGKLTNRFLQSCPNSFISKVIIIMLYSDHGKVAWYGGGKEWTFEKSRPGFKSQLYYILIIAVWSWVSYCTPLNLRFCIREIGIMHLRWADETRQCLLNTCNVVGTEKCQLYYLVTFLPGSSAISMDLIYYSSF